MLRVPHEALWYSADGLYLYEGAPFTGIAYTLWPGGCLEGEVEFREGLRWGSSRGWFRTGAPESEVHFFRDVVHGRMRTWHENGQLAEDGEHEHGITIWQKRWDEQGHPWRITASGRRIGSTSRCCCAAVSTEVGSQALVQRSLPTSGPTRGAVDAFSAGRRHGLGGGDHSR